MPGNVAVAMRRRVGFWHASGRDWICSRQFRGDPTYNNTREPWGFHLTRHFGAIDHLVPE